MIFLLLELPAWATGFNFLLGLFGFVVLVAGAFIVLTVRGKTEVSGMQLDRAVAAEALLKIRDIELAALNVKATRVEDELEDLTAEHRTLVGVNVAQLMEFWLRKEEIEAEMADLKRYIRVLEKRKDGNL
jgi:hypothetical protein